MFYKDIPKKEIPENIKQIYKYQVKPYIGQLVLDGHSIVKLVGMLRDDKQDGEWCVRLLTFPAPYYFHNLREVSDTSLLCADIIPLKGILPKKTYNKLVKSWKMNEEHCPYSKDWTVY